MALTRIKSATSEADEAVIGHQLRDKKELAPSGKSPAYIHRRNNRARAGKLAAGFFNFCALKILFEKELAPSGKSPAYIHHRNNRARAGKPVAGFLNRTAAAFHGAPNLSMQCIVARGVPGELPSET
jgi:hypothetical protein